MFLISMHAQRALVISLIVLGHSYKLGSPEMGGLLGFMVKRFLFSGTSLFVFISGFFFHYVFRSRYQYSQFVEKKFIRIFVPYLALSTLIVVLIRLDSMDNRMGGVFISEGTGFWHTHVLTYLKYIYYGGATTAYWYIPFLMVMFLMSPMHMAYSKLSNWQAILVFTGMFVLSAVVGRINSNTNLIMSIAYFHSFYLLGILVSKNFDQLNRVSRSQALLVLALCVYGVYSVALYNLGEMPGGLYAPAFDKLLQIFILYLLFSHVSQYDFVARPMGYIADRSFAIYFIHPLVIFGMSKTCDSLDLNISHGGWPVFIGASVTVMTATVLAVNAIKRVIGRRSRYLIGW